jgi:undecaprenyl-diphosphatase
MMETLILGRVQGSRVPPFSIPAPRLGEHILNMQQVGILFDVMLHFGTLLAVILVFRKKLWKLIVGCLKRDPEELRYALYIIIASIPTAVIGLGFKDAFESLFENPVCF